MAAAAAEAAKRRAWIDAHAAVARKVLSASDASSASDILLQASASLTELDCCELISSALDSGNVLLAVSLHEAMRNTARRPPQNSARINGPLGFSWPAATMRSTCVLVLGLCRQIAVTDALRAIAEIRIQGVPRHEDVGFGKVITSPLATKRTLTVVQPQEGFKLVADAYSKYEYEVFSGKRGGEHWLSLVFYSFTPYRQGHLQQIRGRCLDGR